MPETCREAQRMSVPWRSDLADRPEECGQVRGGREGARRVREPRPEARHAERFDVSLTYEYFYTISSKSTCIHTQILTIYTKSTCIYTRDAELANPT